MTGKIIKIYKDYDTKKYRLVIEFNEEEELTNAYDRLRFKEKLCISLKEYKERRSLNANAYFHLLVDKIAKSMTPPISPTRCKNILLRDYGQPMYEDGVQVVIKSNIPIDKMLELDEIHCYPTYNPNAIDGVTFYKVYRPTHEYNTAEMSKLIDGTVYEAKEQGIETATPNELERIKALWKVD